MTDFLDSSKEKIDQELVASRGTVFLVWTLDVQGIVSLRAICTEKRFANRYRRAIKKWPNIIRCWIESTITNHLYGQASFEIAYGNGPIKFQDFDKLKPERCGD